MQAASHRFSPRRWLVPLVLTVAAPLLLVALPGSFLSGEPVRTAAPETSFSRFTAGPEAGAQTVMVPEPRSVEVIDAMLGRLPAGDEALLREPLTGLRLAAAAAQSIADPWTARQLAYWSDIFATRLEEMAIPAGTRARLARAVAVYQHDQLGMDAAAVTNAVPTLASGQRTVSLPVDAAFSRPRWMLAALALGSIVVVAGGGFAFGRATSGREAGHRGQWDHA
jgi:hypothetical protein